MFIGHYAVGFASKRLAPQASLGVLMAAPMLLDLIWPFFVLAGWERVHIAPGNTAVMPVAFDAYPFSHSLVGAMVWALLFAGGYWWVTRYRTGAVVIGVGVLSHWILDVISHRADMPLSPGVDTVIGLGLWNSIPGTLVVEGALFLGCVWMYLRCTRAQDRTGNVSLWCLLVLMVGMYAGSFVSPPPPTAKALAWFGLTAWLVPFWTWWIDRHRQVQL